MAILFTYQGKPGVKQRFNVKNESGELMIDFYARNELRINNTLTTKINKNTLGLILKAKSQQLTT